MTRQAITNAPGKAACYPAVQARQDRRRRDIVATARKAFFRNGYGATSMSAIAAELGGSKTTLWTYFPCKQDLFAAVIDDLVDRYGEALRLDLADDGDPGEVLRLLGNSILKAITRPQIVSLHRLVIAEVGRAPDLGRILWKRGAARAHAKLGAWLQGQMTRGALRNCDPAQAATHFIGLCQSGLYFQHLVGAIAKPSKALLAAEVDHAVEVFIRAYGRV